MSSKFDNQGVSQLLYYKRNNTNIIFYTFFYKFIENKKNKKNL